MPADSASASPIFATTHWSDVELFYVQGKEADAARERICAAYWLPLYVFLRLDLRKRGADAEQARDMVQAFFLHLFEKDILRGASPVRGKLRSFLLASLQHFTADEWKRAQRQKRRPPGGWVSLDEADAEQRFRDEFARFDSPEHAYDRACALKLLERALRQLREEYRATGRAALFGQIEPLLQGEDSETPYIELARSAGISEGAFKVAVHRCRKLFREFLDMDIARSVGWQGRDYAALKRDFESEKELQKRVDEEKSHLLAALG